MASSGEHLWPDYQSLDMGVWGERCLQREQALGLQAEPSRQMGPCLRDLLRAPNSGISFGVCLQLPYTPSAAVPVAQTSPAACPSPAGGWRC